jgi:hypothetical protein
MAKSLRKKRQSQRDGECEKAKKALAARDGKRPQSVAKRRTESKRLTYTNIHKNPLF